MTVFVHRYLFSFGLSCIKQEKVKKAVAEWVSKRREGQGKN